MQPHTIYNNEVPETPLVKVSITGPAVWCKLEFLNPSGSTKDRIASFILRRALREGLVLPGGSVIEASSGSTSIAMALACAQLGLRFLAIMPEGVSNERTMMIQAYGGSILLTPKADGIRGAIAESERIAAENGAYLPRQFTNPWNAEAHRTATAHEIWNSAPSFIVDAIVSGVGTGGTLVGLYQGLQDLCRGVVPYYARPIERRLADDPECCSFSARIPGVVECVSGLFTEDCLPGMKTVEVRDEDAIRMTRQLIAAGYPVGPSSGLNYCAALVAVQDLGPDATVVTVFPDRMERYFSTELFQPFRG